MSQKPRDVDKKTGIDGAGYFGAAGYFFGWDGDSFPFYSGPIAVLCPVDRAGYFWGSWVSNAYPNAPSTIPTVAPYKRFSSFLPCFFFCASTP